MKRILSLASFVCAILFAAAGMMMPPQGEISGSVLILVAQLLILCATFLGIKDYHNIINRKLWLKILKTSGASSSTSLWPPSPPCSRPLVSPSGDPPSSKPMNRPRVVRGCFFYLTRITLFSLYQPSAFRLSCEATQKKSDKSDDGNRKRYSWQLTVSKKHFLRFKHYDNK